MIKKTVINIKNTAIKCDLSWRTFLFSKKIIRQLRIQPIQSP